MLGRESRYLDQKAYVSVLYKVYNTQWLAKKNGCHLLVMVHLSHY